MRTSSRFPVASSTWMMNRAILDAFLATPFGEGRHAGRVEKIKALEEG